MIQKEMQNKKGQVTIFIVIAILLVAGIVIYFLFSNGVFSSGAKYPEVNQIVEDCIEEITMDGIYWNGLQGGYYDAPSNSINIDSVYVPIYFNNNKASAIKTETIQEELRKYLQENLVICLNDNNFKKIPNMNISVGNTKEVSVVIEDNQINVEINTPISVSSEESSQIISSFKKEVGFDYVSKLNNLNEFLTMQETEPTMILFSQMELFGKERGIEIEGFELENSSTYVYDFIYPQTKYNSRVYLFSFGVRYK